MFNSLQLQAQPIPQWWFNVGFNAVQIGALMPPIPPGTAVMTPLNSIITGNLSVNKTDPHLIYPTAFPAITTFTPQIFPLLVRGSSYAYTGVNDFVNIALTDSTSVDHLRSIIGLSNLGGVAVYAGNNDQTGAGIRLNAWNSTPSGGGGGTGYPSGSVQTMSTITGPVGGLPPLSFENMVVTPASGGLPTVYNHLFQITQFGTGIIGNNINIGDIQGADVFEVQDQLGLWDANDNTPRFINGNTNHSSLTINANTNYQYGASQSMFGSLYSTSGLNTQGGFLFTTEGQNPWSVFGNYPYSMAPSPTSNMVIANNNVTIGQNVTPPLSAGDILTVLDNMGFYDHDDAVTRSVNGNTNTGELAVHAHRLLTDGATMELYGGGYTTTPSLKGGLKFTTTGGPGTANGWSVFASNSGTSTSINNMVVGIGQTTIGRGIDPTNTFYNDVLTVSNAIGFYNFNWSTGPFTNAINGNADKGTLQISANNNGADAESNIQLNGNNCGDPSGTIVYDATVDGYFSNSFGHLFNVNVGFGTIIPVMGVSNQGNVTIGPGAYGTTGVSPTWMAAGDYLTVQQQIGLWAPTDAMLRMINGNTTTGEMLLHANTDYTNGADIEMYGAGNTTYPGVVRYITPGTTGESGMFQSYDGTSFHNSLDIWNNGQVAVGRDMDVSVANPNDQLTVLNQLGMYSPGDATEVDINGNTVLQKLQIGAGRTPQDGSALELFGRTASSTPGAIKYTSAGTTGESAMFQNYDAPGTTGGAFHTNMDIWNNGHVTIGHDLDVSMASSSDVLTVLGQIGFYNTPGAPNFLNGNETTGVFVINGNTASTDGPGIEMYGKDFPAAGGENRAGSFHFWSYSATAPDPAHPKYGWMYGNYDPTNTWLYQAAITNTGKMIIGHGLITGDPTIYTPGNYSLYVENGILTEHVHVALHSTVYWADNVFEKNYKLMPIDKLQNYIHKNNHLPGIPSAKEVVKDGIDVGDMDAKLLQKIEELTLYVVQQQKSIDEQQKKIAELQKQVLDISKK